MISQCIGICVALVPGAAMAASATTAPAATPHEVLRAQLHVLSSLHRSQNDPREKEFIDLAIQRYVSKGVPPAAFGLAELKHAALLETARLVQAGAGSTAVAIARGAYGINPDELYTVLPARTVDAAEKFRGFLQSHDRDLLRQIHAEPLDPRSVSELVTLADQADPAAHGALASILAQDWSQEGKAYLYRRLQTAQTAAEQEQLVSVLSHRKQVDATALAAVASRTVDDTLLQSIFRLADLSAHSDPEAKKFLVQQLLEGQARQRELAMNAISHHRDRSQEDLIKSVIAGEKDVSRRVSLLGHLGAMAGQPRMLKFLRELMMNDPAPQARVAALKAIPNYAIRPADGPPHHVGMLLATVSPEELRRIATTGPAEFLGEVEAKLALAAQEATELERRQDQHRESLKALGSRPGQ